MLVYTHEHFALFSDWLQQCAENTLTNHIKFTNACTRKKAKEKKTQRDENHKINFQFCGFLMRETHLNKENCRYLTQ